MEIESKVSVFGHMSRCFCTGYKRLRNKVIGVLNHMKAVAEEDPRRVIHSIKMGLALSLISIVYYFNPFYDGFGVSAMWAVLTVVVVFEFTVGATLGKGLNRGIATCIAGALGIAAHHLAGFAGDTAEPVLLGFFVFVLATTASFSRFFPGIKARYDYGVLIFILTFSLVSVSGYRVEKIIELAHQRLSTILIGSFTCVFISVFVCPVWAGEELHKLIALNMEKIADFLEGFGGELFDNNKEHSKDDKSVLQRYKSVLNSKTTEETMANFARWEPKHGSFKFRHPWKQYLKIGAVTRECAYRVDALNGYLNSNVQAPHEFKTKIQEKCTKISVESGKALRELALGITTMTHTNAADEHILNANIYTEELKETLKTSVLANTSLLQVIPVTTVASLLIEITICTEKIAESVYELGRLVKFKTTVDSSMKTIDNSIVTLDKPNIVHLPPVSKNDGDHFVVIISGLPLIMDTGVKVHESVIDII
ncbi:hypothetical protein GIB67_042062 [Kingdonia uniflora]|uniref:Aluminum-activated malate transporter n=1 Tax=Kingdonia uniflora TaxID=39325 RepID=A0A7J7MVN1_9MAGN|nr:hypothetical protein GIB67_042062 [Kingdonia uniflora]